MREERKKRLNYFFHSSKIFVQLIVFSFIIGIVPFTIESMIFVKQLTDSAEEILGKSHSQLVRQYMYNINESLFRYEDRLYQIADNTLILDELMAEGGQINPYIRGEKISTEVNKCLRLESNREFKNCMIYSNLEQIPVYGKRVAMIEAANNENWYSAYRLSRQDNFIYMSADNNPPILSVIQDIDYINTDTFIKKEIGLIQLEIYADRLFMPAKETETGFCPYDVVVMDENSNIIYSTKSGYNYIPEAFGPGELKQGEMQDGMMVFEEITSRYGLRVVFLFDQALMLAEKNNILKIYMPILIIITGIIFLAVFLFTKSLSNRVERLVNKIKMAETGNLTITEEITGNDEIAILDRQFNHMLKRLDELIQKNYIQQLEKKETELKNLQLQINPHFLYNTLETISSMAAVKQAFEVCDLCEKLGDIFRYSLGKTGGGPGDLVTIEQELNHTKNYIFIQKTRFGNKFDVVYQVEPGLEKKKTLRFILQPIVENAIIHGLSRNKGKGSLEIMISAECGEAIIRITDNGVGIDPLKLLQLTAYINASDSRLKDREQSIGVRNVNQRIKLTFGEPYGILIQSRLNYGSSFTIRQPLIE